VHRDRHGLFLDPDALRAAQDAAQGAARFADAAEPLFRLSVDLAYPVLDLLDAVGAKELYSRDWYAPPEEFGGPSGDDGEQSQRAGQPGERRRDSVGQPAGGGLIDDRRQDAVEVQDEPGSSRCRRQGLKRRWPGTRPCPCR
jgi:hypothetical protein